MATGSGGRASPVMKVGILAGGGTLPLEVARSIQRAGGQVHMVALEGEIDQSLADIPHTIVNWGAIGRMLRTFREEGCTDLVILGRVSRPDLGRIRPDLGFYLSLPAILRILASGGDDGVLRRVVRFFEGRGFRVVGPHEVAPEIVVGEAALGRVQPSTEDRSDVALGFRIVRALGAFDMGQAVVVRDGRLLAVEGVEGTDRLLRRLAAGAAATGGGVAGAPRAGTLVKRPKPGQELRVDMPAIGPQTVEIVAATGLAGIAVLAGATLVAERERLIAAADAAGLFVAGLADQGAPGPGDAETLSGRHAVAQAPARWSRLGTTGAREADLAEATLGALALEALAPFVDGGSVVVSRRHVLAMEPGGPLADLLARVPQLRQWGDRRRKRPLGVAVTSAGSALAEAGPAVIAEALAKARLGTIALVAAAAHSIEAEALAVAADRLGIAVLVPSDVATPGAGTGRGRGDELG